MNYEKYKEKREKEHKQFMKMMEELMKRHKDAPQHAKELEGDYDENEHFVVWNIIGDAYHAGYDVAYTFFRDELFDLTDAEEHFREEIRKKI